MKKENLQNQTPPKPWHTYDVPTTLKELNAKQKGLTTDEAKQRKSIYGSNSLPQKKPTSVLVMFLQEIINPIVIILLVAMAFSFVVGEWLDGFVILAIVMIDAIIGTIQSKRAERIASSLSGMIKVKAKTLRDGKKQEIDSTDLVPGDICYLESGDKISADMRIISCSNFTVDEALLTGESLNAEKSTSPTDEKASLGDRSCMVFSGSSVITGRATCVVVETGHSTQIGNIATNLNQVKDEKSPLTIRIDKFSKQISIGIVAVSVLIFLIMLIQGNPFKDIFLCVIALAVSAMPEGLPLAVTMALTIASNRMGKNNVVVKNLNAVESLGSCTVIATDKTGTLTLNEQTAKIITLADGSEYNVSGSGYNLDGKVQCKDDNIEKIRYIANLGNLNNEAEFSQIDGSYKYFGDSIDIAFKVLAGKLNETDTFDVIHRIPYESENKYSAVFFNNGDKQYVTVKGSTERLLDMCLQMQSKDSPIKIDKKQILAQTESLASRGYRVIALAVGEVAKQDKYGENDLKNLTFLGMVGFIDPVRKESKTAIADCHRAGIKVIMITGDHPLTAYSIAKDIKIANSFDSVATGKEVAEAFECGEEYFDNFVKTKTVFSRVTPTDKLNIVNSLKRQGEFVAVTGDGVNDSPAIKSAHIGIAMGSGTDVSKETADMIIIDDNFNSIVQGVKEGRAAYSNIRKITYFLFSCSIAEVLFFVLALLSGSGTPLVAIQLLWLNVVTDGFQDLALSLEKPEDGIMNEKPRPTNESLFSKSMIIQSLLIGLTIGLTVFGAWEILLNVFNDDLIVARSLIMALMVFMQNFHAINCRSETVSIFKQKFNNWFFAVSVALSIGLQILFMEIPFLSQFLELTTVPYSVLAILLAISLIVVVVSEIYKLIIRQRAKTLAKK